VAVYCREQDGEPLKTMTMQNEQNAAEQTNASSEQATSGSADMDLQAALNAAEARATEHRDLYMRALAELDNVRKRATRDVEHAHKFAIDRFANDLMGVKDSLELGLASEATGEALRAGTEATLKLLAKAFEKAGLIELDPAGEPFNPEFHEAMAMQPSAEQPPNTVAQVVQKGYQLNGRLLRPARVIVTREP
jgi:molecular chaperone GrpE